VYKRASAELPEDFNYPLAIATIYAARNRTDEALSWLRIAIERGSRDYRWLKIEPLFVTLRNDSRFQEIMNALQTRIAQMRTTAIERGLMRQ
jgi:hypothetical protein